MTPQSIIAEIARDFPDAWAGQGIPEGDLSVLRAAAGGDPARFRTLLKRRLAGDPVAYVLGRIEFRGRRFRMDRRAHITDPETTHLVDAVVAAARDLPKGAVVAEVGVGAGALAISVALEAPGATLVGLDVDADALALCRANQALHGLTFDLLESDMLHGWGRRLPPALLFGDLPWGDESTVYDDFRDVRHYLHMPPAAAFPLGDRTSAQRELIQQVVRLGWPTRVMLNCGTLPEADIRALAAAAPGRRAVVHRPAPTAALLDIAVG